MYNRTVWIKRYSNQIMYILDEAKEEEEEEVEDRHCFV